MILQPFVIFFFLISTSFTGKQGTLFDLTWQESINRNDLEELMQDSYLLSYRKSHAFDYLSDQEIKESVSDYCKSSKSSFPQIVITAKDGQEIAGFAIFEKVNETTVYLADLIISKNYWRQGLGSKLAFSILEKEPQVKKILLITEIRNTETHHFYESIGFEPSKEYKVPNDYRSYEWKLG